MRKDKEMSQAAASVPEAKAGPGMVDPAAKAKKKGDLMYLGPTIMGAVRRGTVFKDGILPEKAKECIAALPMMERLFVEMEKMPGAVKELRKKQSALRVVYGQVAAHFNVQKM